MVSLPSTSKSSSSSSIERETFQYSNVRQVEIFIKINFDRHCANMFFVYLMWSLPHPNWWHNFTPLYRLGKVTSSSGLHAVLSDMTFQLSTLSKPKIHCGGKKYSKQRDLREQNLEISIIQAAEVLDGHHDTF